METDIGRISKPMRFQFRKFFNLAKRFATKKYWPFSKWNRLSNRRFHGQGHGASLERVHVVILSPFVGPVPPTNISYLEFREWLSNFLPYHYSDVIMGAMASQITSFTIVCSTVYSGADQRKHQSSASLVFVRGIRRWPVNSPHKWPVRRKMFPFDDVIIF